MKRHAPAVTVVRRCTAMRIPRKRIESLVKFLVRCQRGADVREVEVAVVGDREMAVLNRTYHGIRGTTDVLSFNLAEVGEPFLLQIVVCAPEALRQARLRSLPPQRELLLYVAHGLLHWLGFDDATPAQAKVMEGQQKILLEKFFKFSKNFSTTKKREL